MRSRCVQIHECILSGNNNVEVEESEYMCATVISDKSNCVDIV